jgi:hypothetical protein
MWPEGSSTRLWRRNRPLDGTARGRRPRPMSAGAFDRRCHVGETCHLPNAPDDRRRARNPDPSRQATGRPGRWRACRRRRCTPAPRRQNARADPGRSGDRRFEAGADTPIGHETVLAAQPPSSPKGHDHPLSLVTPGRDAGARSRGFLRRSGTRSSKVTINHETPPICPGQRPTLAPGLRLATGDGGRPEECERKNPGCSKGPFVGSDD